jgi:hypothetical protein
VYDTGDPTEPLKSEWFELKSRNKRWTNDLVGRGPGPQTTTRCYAAEHVLEWQMLTSFIEEDRTKDDDSRCAFLITYFAKTKMPKTIHKVQAAKDKGKLEPNKHFTYDEVDYDFSKWVHGKGKDKRDPTTLDWIGKCQDISFGDRAKRYLIMT